MLRDLQQVHATLTQHEHQIGQLAREQDAAARATEENTKLRDRLATAAHYLGFITAHLVHGPGGFDPGRMRPRRPLEHGSLLARLLRVRSRGAPANRQDLRTEIIPVRRECGRHVPAGA